MVRTRRAVVAAVIPMLLAAGCARTVAGSAAVAPVNGTVGRSSGPSTPTEPSTGTRPTGSGSTAPGAVDVDGFLDRLQAANEQVTSTVGTFDLQGPDRSTTTFTVTQQDGVARDWEVGLTLPDDPTVDAAQSGIPDLEVTVRMVDGQTYLAGDGVLGPLGITTPWMTPAPDAADGAVKELADTFAELRHGLGPEFVDQLNLALTSVELIDNGQLEGLGDTPVDVRHFRGDADPRYLIDADSGAGPVRMDLYLDEQDRLLHAVFTQATADGDIVGTMSVSAFDTVPAIEAPAPAEVTAR